MSNPNTPAKRERWRRWYYSNREMALARMGEYRDRKRDKKKLSRTHESKKGKITT